MDTKPIFVVSRMINALRDLDQTMPVDMVATFFAVAADEGITMKLLGERLDMPQSSVSRNVSVLSKWGARHKPGLDLVVTEEDPAERRRKIVRLTPKGRRMVSEFTRSVKGG